MIHKQNNEVFSYFFILVDNKILSILFIVYPRHICNLKLRVIGACADLWRKSACIFCEFEVID